MSQFLGKYRAIVSDNKDPLMLGRLRLLIPSVLGSKTVSAWALPCVPFAGPGVGTVFVPPVKAAVWAEFEGGDVSKPVWTGCFWTSPVTVSSHADTVGRETPAEAVTGYPVTKVVKTNGVTLVIDAAGNVTVTTAGVIYANGDKSLALKSALDELKQQHDDLVDALKDHGHPGVKAGPDATTSVTTTATKTPLAAPTGTTKVKGV